MPSVVSSTPMPPSDVRLGRRPFVLSLAALVAPRVSLAVERGRPAVHIIEPTGGVVRAGDIDRKRMVIHVRDTRNRQRAPPAR